MQQFMLADRRDDFAGRLGMIEEGEEKKYVTPPLAIHVIDSDGQNLRQVTDGKVREILGR